MKKTNTIIIATIIATFVISMFAFQPTITKASNNASPTATPPRTIKPKTKTKLVRTNSIIAHEAEEAVKRRKLARKKSVFDEGYEPLTVKRSKSRHKHN